MVIIMVIIMVVIRHRLCADIMQGGDEGVRRAILFAVGNTVVSDTLDAARVLCSGQDGKKARKKERTTRGTNKEKRNKFSREKYARSKLPKSSYAPNEWIRLGAG